MKIYHAADRNDRYCLGAFLLDEKDPSIVLAKTKDPIEKVIMGVDIVERGSTAK